MKIAVLVKEVPDTWGDRHLDLATKRVDRSGEVVVDEVDEKAVEIALQLQSAHPGSDVTLVTMGPAGALGSLRKGLAMGADRAIHIVDDALSGSDAVQTSAALAAALGSRGFDLVIAGNESTDGRTAAVPAMLAERLGVAQATNLRTLTVAGDSGGSSAGDSAAGMTVSGERVTDGGSVEVSTTLPAVVSVTEQIAEARYPSFKGIMSAKKKPVEVLTVAELGLAVGDTGSANSWSVVHEVTPRPPRTVGTIITDDGTAAAQLTEYLAAAKLI